MCIRDRAIHSAIMKTTTTDLNNAEVRELMFDVFTIGKNNIAIYQLPGDSKYISNVSYFVADKTETKNLVNENFR